MFGAGAGREARLLELAYELEEAGPWARIQALSRRRAGQPISRSARSRCVSFSVVAPLAQSAERLHGKEKVYGSIP